MNSKERDEFIASNLGLVHSCANRFRGRGVEYDDLYQAGCVGLIKAADGFDWGRGLRFSTYAVPVILGEIRRIFRDGGAVKVGRTLKELSLKVSRTADILRVKNGEDPTVGEIAQELGIDPESVTEALCAAKAPISMTPEEDEVRELVSQDFCEEKITEQLDLLHSMEILPSADRSLIYLRYFKEKTQAETARQLGTTQVQISRREKRIIARLREEMESRTESSKKEIRKTDKKCCFVESDSL